MKPLKTKHAEYRRENGIIIVACAEGLTISPDIAEEMVKTCKQFCDNKSAPLLMDLKGLASIDTASRKYFAAAKVLENISAMGILVAPLISKLAGNIFIQVDKPTVPVKLFTDKSRALIWLQNFIK